MTFSTKPIRRAPPQDVDDYYEHIEIVLGVQIESPMSNHRAPTDPPFSVLEEEFFAAGEALTRETEAEETRNDDPVAARRRQTDPARHASSAVSRRSGSMGLVT
jgi:hypothetical protein